MSGMIVQEMTKLSGKKILKLISYGAGSRGDIPGRFETTNQSREKLKINRLKIPGNRIAKSWFIKKDKAKFFYLCNEAGKKISI
tara:strand:+ start:468 stop:719 length:252 start_codon:yes stop_codon:yes gene_type:complete